VFGRIVRAQYFPEFNCIWLYSEGFNNPNIYVTPEVGIYLMDRFGIRDIALLADVFVLVIGAVRVSMNGKRYVYLDDPRHIAVDPGRDL